MADNVSHSLNLLKLCRVCGKILADKTIYEVKDFTFKLQDSFRASFIRDESKIHPPNFCHVCFSTMQNVEKRNKIHSIFPIIWQPHNADNCLTCNLAATKAMGGRPTKKGKYWTFKGLKQM